LCEFDPLLSWLREVDYLRAQPEFESLTQPGSFRPLSERHYVRRKSNLITTNL
jgi:hypothetical protein